MIIVAHRGDSAHAPENTLAAFQRAWKKGADAIELDVHLTRDKRIAVIHDEHAQRTTACDQFVRDMTLQELQAHSAGRWFHPAFAAEKVPALEQVLAQVPAGKRVFIEIKCAPDIVPYLKRVVDRSGLAADQVVILSFSLQVLRAARPVFKSMELLWNVDMRRSTLKRWTPSISQLIRTARQERLDALGIRYCSGVTAEFVRTLRDTPLRLFIWTTDSLRNARKLERMGVDYLAMNDPAVYLDAR